MTKRLLTLAFAAAAISGMSVRANFTFTFGEFNKAEETCTMLSCTGTAPANGQLVIPNHYTDRTEGKVYMVSKIADHVLDNLPDVTEVVIPSNVKVIGDADYLGLGGTNNFYNCPKLAKFTVDDNNKAFDDDEGCLRQRYSFTLQRVPTLLEVENGTFTLYLSYEDVAPDAFHGNTTISTIVFNPGINWTGNEGTSSMPNLKQYRIGLTEDAIYHRVFVRNNLLYNYEETKVLSCPPAQTSSNVTFLSSTKEIGNRAFENVKNMDYIGFGGDNIVFGNGAFRNCTALRNVYISGKNCTLGNACFKGCTNLTSVNWGTNLDFAADSIFADCGFTDVTFAQGTLPAAGITLGNGMFDGCQQLKKIDMSKLEGTQTTGHVKIKSGITSNCPNLTTFIFPPFTDFLGNNYDTPNMGLNSNIENIVLGTFTFENTDCPAFLYKDKQHNPKVYYSPDFETYDHPLKFLFGFAYPGSYDLTVYSSVNDVTFGPPFSRKNWIVPNATYWVPGGSYSNYDAGFQYNCKLNESYFLHYYNDEGKLRINFTTFDSPKVVINRVFVNDGYVGAPDASGNLSTDINVTDAQTACVQYTVNGFPFTTYYASISNVEAAVEEVADDVTRIDMLLDGRTLRLNIPASLTLADLTGKTLLSAASTTAADLTALPAGIYVVKAQDTAGHTSVRKISLR